MDKNQTDKNYTIMTRRIGSTTYKVKVFLADTGQETLEDKILRIISRDMVTNVGTCGIINIPQISRQSERSA